MTATGEAPPPLPLRADAPWRIAIGLGVPFTAILLAARVVPDGAGPFGISMRSWSLFACAPLTSLCLWLCGRGQDDDTEVAA